MFWCRACCVLERIYLARQKIGGKNEPARQNTAHVEPLWKSSKCEHSLLQPEFYVQKTDQSFELLRVFPTCLSSRYHSEYHRKSPAPVVKCSISLERERGVSSEIHDGQILSRGRESSELQHTYDMSVHQRVI